jgi:carboxylate-amine ligase
MEETLALAALIQAVVVKLYRLRVKNIGWRRYSRSLIMENKWRAVRYGIEGKLIDFGLQEEVSAKDLTLELLAFIEDVVEELGSQKEIGYIHKILKEGTSADRQLATFAETNDLTKVVDRLLVETMEGL